MLRKVHVRVALPALDVHVHIPLGEAAAPGGHELTPHLDVVGSVRHSCEP